MARDTHLCSIAQVAAMIGENLELIEIVTANPDNIDDGEIVYVHDGTDEGITAFTLRGIESLKEFLADVRTWDGGIRQFLVDCQCEPAVIDRIMAQQAKS